MSSNQTIDIYISTFTGKELSDTGRTKITDQIFYLFRELTNDPELEHTRDTIFGILMNPNSLLSVAVVRENNNYKLIGFILAAPVDEYPGLIHIQYLYTSPQFRNIGVATKLLNVIRNIAQKNKYDRISLTFDTYDKKLSRFYLNNGFVFDPSLRSYKRRDMLVKHIS